VRLRARPILTRNAPEQRLFPAPSLNGNLLHLP